MYKLNLTDDDVATIAFSGQRYGWSASLQHLDAGEHEISESEAWEICRAIKSDTEGGHSYFPLLAPRSDLAYKLLALMESIV
jgi:hypothetical protein